MDYNIIVEDNNLLKPFYDMIMREIFMTYEACNKMFSINQTL